MWLVRFVSRHELFPIRAPLMALEHCIAPFLDRCDEDDDHRITLAEWGKCLQLDEVIPHYFFTNMSYINWLSFTKAGVIFGGFRDNQFL